MNTSNRFLATLLIQKLWAFYWVGLLLSYAINKLLIVINSYLERISRLLNAATRKKILLDLTFLATIFYFTIFLYF